MAFFRLDRNPLGPAGMTVLVDCMVKLVNLELLGYGDYIEVITSDVIHD